MFRSRKIKFYSLTLLSSILLIGCGPKSFDPDFDPKTVEIIDDNYRNYYEIFVASFADSDGDGMGDLNGVTSKLDYIQDLGFTGIWLMPINESSSYHKYNVDDYYAIDEDYGTMEDFENLIEEAHKRDIKVIIDLVLNHSGNRNEWFGKSYRAYSKKIKNQPLTEEEEKFATLYSFSETQLNGYQQVPGFSFYYEANFSNDMPEFNWDSEFFTETWHDIVDFYNELGVDGYRLDAVKYYYLNDDTKNVEALKAFNDYVKTSNPDAYIVGENWSEPSSIERYYDSECDSFFAFFASSANGDGGFIKDSLYYQGYPAKYLSGLKELERVSIKGIAAPFLDNHDMGRIRLSSQPNWNKFMYGLLSMLPGTTFTYYGDEINMSGGQKPDQNYRIHMDWGDPTIETEDPKGTTISEYDYPNVKDQYLDANSKLNYVKKANYLRNTIKEIARGSLTNEKIDEINKYLVLEKTYNNEKIYILLNFNENSEVEIDLSSISYQEVIGELNMNYFDKATINNKVATLKPYGILILK